MNRTMLLLAVVLLAVPACALASKVTVPDDHATIQAALDSGADTVFVRSGNYPEALTMSGYAAQSLLAAPPPDGVSWGPMPVVTSLTDAPANLLRELRGFVFSGPVHVSGGTLTGCWFGAGLTVGARGGVVRNNTVFGDLSVPCAHADIVMNTVIGGTITANPIGDCFIHRNVVVGPAETGMRLYSDSRVRDNYVRGCGVGIHLSGEFTDATGNLIEDCTGTAILVEQASSGGDVLNNTIRRCGGDAVRLDGSCCPHIVGNAVDSVAGTGIYARATGLTVAGNTVREAGGTGMDIAGAVVVPVTGNHIVGTGSDGAVVSGQILPIRQNVVGRSGGRGLVVTGEEVTVRSNTLYLNADAGLDLSGTSSAGVNSVDHNIAYQNDVGLRWDGLGTAVLGCNDWYANPTANTQGISPGATDLSLNPLFCDMAADDVSLSAVSALLNPAGCGLIGALGEGCPYPAAVTPEPGAVLSGLGVFPQPGRGEVRLSWQGTNDATEVAIYDVTGARRWSATTAPGAGEVVWRGMDDEGRPLPAGVYFARVRSGERQAAANVVLVR